MKKLNKVAVLFASAVIAAPMAFAQVSEGGNNWRTSDGSPLQNGVEGLCWRDPSWTPKTADEDCDGAPKPAPVVAAPAPAPKPAPAPAPAPRAAAPAPAAPAPAAAPAAPAPRPAPAPVSEKVTYGADAFFDFDRATLKPEAQAKLDDLIAKTNGVALEVIIAVGHTDSVGSNNYNQRLSIRRAEAVKAYLVSKGVEQNRVYTEGKGERQPVADNKTAEGRAKNRRVEIEVVGTKTR